MTAVLESLGGINRRRKKSVHISEASETICSHQNTLNSSSSKAMNGNEETNSTAFRDAVFQNELLPRMQLGENHCLEFTNSGIGSDVLALSQIVRSGNPASLVDQILSRGTAQDIADMVVLQFVTRNSRGGKGEKTLSMSMFLRFFRVYPNTGKKLLPFFPHYGYWKDLLLLLTMAKMETDLPKQDELFEACMDVIKQQLQKDLAGLQQYKNDLAAAQQRGESQDNIDKLRQKGPKMSLLAKWLPREGSHFDKSINFVQRFVDVMWPEGIVSAAMTDTNDQSWKSCAKGRYRKMVAELTTYLELPEVLLSAQREDEINFARVASKATMNLTKTFLNEDKLGNQRSNNPKRVCLSERFMDYVQLKGLKGGQVMPHEIVKAILTSNKISKSQELVLDAQWKDIWKGVLEQVQVKAAHEGVEFNPTRMVPLSDVSGSMEGIPMEVAIALGIGISEITHESFRDMVLTFEEKPRWHKLNSSDNIVGKVRSLANAPWGGSTNFELAYDLILDVALRHKLSREDMPSLIVFSDMQFNEASGFDLGIGTMHDTISRKFKNVANRLKWSDDHPTPIVYWNLRNTGGHPVDKDTEGAVLLSGFSPSLLKLVMNGEALREEEVELLQLDGTVKTEKVRVKPEQVLRKMLDDSMYDPIREVLIESLEGKLIEYEIPLNGHAGSTAGVSTDDDFEIV